MNGKPHLIREVKDDQAGLHGFLVIDTLTAGRSCGGVRMLPDVTLDEVKALARAMTKKYGFLNDHTVGGAKAGVVIPYDCPAEKKQEILGAFGRSIAPLLQSGHYIPWTDMNAGPDDIAVILESAGVKPGRMPDSSRPTALSVLGSIQAACIFNNLQLPEITAAIEGLGNVGTHLARELSSLGVKIIATSTRKKASTHRGEPIDHRALLELEVDVLIPAARPWTIDETNAGKIRAKIVAPAANCPATPAAEETLERRGVLVIPDFVANLGGIYGSRLEGRMSPQRIHDLFIGPFRDLVLNLLRRARAEGISPRMLAERIAEENFSRFRHGKSSSRLLRQAALALIDSPLIPGRLTNYLLYRWAKKDLASKPLQPI
jgi:glutamate dehydrogenase/leucine dehydrogenase